MTIEQIAFWMVGGVVIAAGGVVAWTYHDDNRLRLDPTESERQYALMRRRRDQRQSPYPGFAEGQTIFADVGEIVVCESGHYIATVSGRMLLGGGINQAPLLRFDGLQRRPVLGADMADCCCVVCGGLWVMGGSLHFKDGWR